MLISKVIQKMKQKMKRVGFIYYPYINAREERENKRGIKLLHTYGYELLPKIMKELEKTEMTAFCAYGTALGLVRDGDFIKTDNDIDIGIIDDDSFSWELLDTILTGLSMRLSREFTCEGKMTERTYKKNGLGVDFFLYMKEGDKLKSNIYYRELGKEYNSDNEFQMRYLLSPSITACVKKCIHGMEVLIPDNVEAYLESAYGEGWRVYDPNFKSLAIPVQGIMAEAKFYK